MSACLLATKFYIPPPREDVVTRPRLTEKVLAGANRPQAFTLLSGPAGSGKTTLLSQFVTHFRRPVAWLSLDEADDDPIRFWTYLLAACQSVLEGVGESALALLETAQALPDDTVPTLLINELAGQETALVLLLDDFHVIHNPSIHAGFSFLLDHLPGNLHVVVSTRVDPPWPLSRHRARNQLVEIRARDLRFSREEVAEFLRRTADLNLPHRGRGPRPRTRLALRRRLISLPKRDRKVSFRTRPFLSKGDLGPLTFQAWRSMIFYV